MLESHWEAMITIIIMIYLGVGCIRLPGSCSVRLFFVCNHVSYDFVLSNTLFSRRQLHLLKSRQIHGSSQRTGGLEWWVKGLLITP